MARLKTLTRSSVSLLMAASIIAAVGCGSKDKADDDDTTTGAIKFSDISPIIVASCGTSNCHGKGASVASYVYEDNEPNFKNSAKVSVPTKTRLNSTDTAIKMPKEDASNKTISAADKQKLIDFLDQ